MESARALVIRVDWCPFVVITRIHKSKPRLSANESTPATRKALQRRGRSQSKIEQPKIHNLKSKIDNPPLESPPPLMLGDGASGFALGRLAFDRLALVDQVLALAQRHLSSTLPTPHIATC